MRQTETAGPAEPREIAANSRCVDKGESGAQNDFGFASVGPTNAQVAELADALDSGSSDRKVVEVRILSWADPHT